VRKNPLSSQDVATSGRHGVQRPLAAHVRNRIGRELHDELAQELVGVSLVISSVMVRLPDALAPLHSDLARVTETLLQSVTRCRTLAYAIAPNSTKPQNQSESPLEE
jgi:signal transduction histidine kinase